MLRDTRLVVIRRPPKHPGCQLASGLLGCGDGGRAHRLSRDSTATRASSDGHSSLPRPRALSSCSWFRNPRRIAAQAHAVGLKGGRRGSGGWVMVTLIGQKGGAPHTQYISWDRAYKGGEATLYYGGSLVEILPVAPPHPVCPRTPAYHPRFLGLVPVSGFMPAIR